MRISGSAYVGSAILDCTASVLRLPLGLSCRGCRGFSVARPRLSCSPLMRGGTSADPGTGYCGERPPPVLPCSRLPSRDFLTDKGHGGDNLVVPR